MRVALLAAAGLLFSAGAVSAQSADQSATAPAPEAAAPAPDAAAPAGEATFTDEQINDFASAMVKIQNVAADPSIDETQKQTKMVEIVQAEGLDPETFNAIGSASQSDPALQQRVQVAFASAMGQSANQ